MQRPKILLAKKNLRHIRILLGPNTTSDHVQSGSFKQNNKKLWLPRNIYYSSWQTRLKPFENKSLIIFLITVSMTESYQILLQRKKGHLRGFQIPPGVHLVNHSEKHS